MGCVEVVLDVCIISPVVELALFGAFLVSRGFDSQMPELLRWWFTLMDRCGPHGGSGKTPWYSLSLSGSSLGTQVTISPSHSRNNLGLERSEVKLLPLGRVMTI